MDITQKRTIVRESLVFIAVLLLSLLAFLLTYAYNWYYNHKIHELALISISNKITADSLSNSYQKKELKQNWFFEEMGIATPLNTPEKFLKDYTLYRKLIVLSINGMETGGI